MKININDRITVEKDNIKFVRCYKSEDVFEGKGKKIEFEEDVDMEVAVFRLNGNLHCFSNICPHRHQPDMHNGIIRDNKIMCPQHGWTYFYETGINVNQHQGIKNLKKYSIFEEDGWVWVEIPEMNIPKWRGVPISN